jgi:signal transduction histidine kinase
VRSLRTALIALAAGALAFGLLSVALILSSEHFDGPGLGVASALVIGWSFIGTGLFAWWRRPGNRIGPLMTALGFAWLLGYLSAADAPAVFITGVLADTLAYGVLIHMLLAYPSGRLRTRAERVVVVAGYVVAAVFDLPRLLFDPQGYEHCEGCPANPLLISDEPTLAASLEAVHYAAGITIVAVLLAILVSRWRAAGPSGRRRLTPVLFAGGATAALVIPVLLTSAAGLPQEVAEAMSYVSLIPLACVPYAFLGGLLRSRLARAEAVSHLVGRLGDTTDPGCPRCVRDALADALGDPDLDLAYWLPDESRYVDSAGRDYELPFAEDPFRATTVVELDGGPVAAIVHSRALSDDEELTSAAAAAASLALENERLAAELRARVDELSSSRARIVDAGDRARRRLERDLHDGAQQRLVGLAISLRMARDRIDDDPEAARAMLEEAMGELKGTSEELRELARGIHPPVLSERGLVAALEALGGRSPMPVELTASPGERLPRPVESAAYFVVAESLTNAVRYADASGAEVTLSRQNGSLEVEVRDDGRGGADPEGGSGLRGLSDRLAALEGSLEVVSPRGEGTVVRARIPVDGG